MPSSAGCSCTEIACLRLKPGRTTEQLESEPAHNQALEILSRQPGFLSCTWGILQEDATMLVWLVGEPALRDPAAKDACDAQTSSCFSQLLFLSFRLSQSGRQWKIIPSDG